jgi:hypothetical protein
MGHAGRRLRTFPVLTQDGAEAGLTKHVGRTNATDHPESNPGQNSARNQGMAAAIYQLFGATVRRESQVSFDYLGALGRTCGQWLMPKGARPSRAQSIDYLGAASERSGNRVASSPNFGRYCRNSSGLCDLAELLVRSIPKVAGRGPFPAPVCLAGLCEVSDLAAFCPRIRIGRVRLSSREGSKTRRPRMTQFQDNP